MLALGDLAGGNFRSTAENINDLGQVVGRGDSASGFEAFIWDAKNGMVSLGDLPGGQLRSSAQGINDLSQVVGSSYDSLGTQAFIWEASSGMLKLQDLVVDGSATGWQLQEARGINNRGEITGFGKNPLGNIESFLLVPVYAGCQ